MDIHWHTLFFFLSAILACGFALAVVLASNIVRMAVYLIASLGAVSLLFFLAGANFLGATQLMVYVGGTVVLLVFGVMLTARGPFVAMQTGASQWVMAAVLGGSLIMILLQAAFSVRPWTTAGPQDVPALAAGSSESAVLGMGLLGVRTDRLQEPNAKVQAGMSGYLLAFEIISVHLVVVLVGAAYLARTRKPGTA